MHDSDWLILLLTKAAGGQYSAIKQSMVNVYLPFGAEKYGIITMSLSL